MKAVLLNFCYLFSGVLNTSKVLKEECKINPQSNVISKNSNMKKNPILAESSGLRKRAEDALQGKTEELQKPSSRDALSLIHELQVHQIELEMQNEELQRAQKELEKSRDRYSDLYDFAPVSYFSFDKDGLIIGDCRITL
jgi:hypothetical protein